MLSPKTTKDKSQTISDVSRTRGRGYATRSVLPFSSSAAKKAARQSSSVTMGPQNQLGIQDTTNLPTGHMCTCVSLHGRIFFTLYFIVSLNVSDGFETSRLERMKVLAHYSMFKCLINMFYLNKIK